MTSLFRTCLDGHRCENGSSCAEHPTEEGKYYCDCNTSSGDFAGLFCEYPAENYCQMQSETSETWFCANMGVCSLSKGGQGASWSCDCPSEFEGPHCQFVKGNVPSDWPGFDYDPSTGSLSVSRKQEGGLHIAVSIFIGIAAAVLLALVGFFVVRKIRNRDGSVAQHATRDPSEGLKLEADGSVLQEVMQQFKRTPNSTAMDGSHDGFDLSLGMRSSDDHSIEVGVNGYSDNPHSHRNGTTNGNIL